MKCEICEKDSVTTKHLRVRNVRDEIVDIFICGFCRRFALDPESIVEEVKQNDRIRTIART